MTLDSPIRVVLEVIPEKYITYDGVKMFLDEAGKLPAGAKGPPKSSDGVRLRRELARRGLAKVDEPVPRGKVVSVPEPASFALLLPALVSFLKRSDQDSLSTRGGR